MINVKKKKYKTNHNIIDDSDQLSKNVQLKTTAITIKHYLTKIIWMHLPNKRLCMNVFFYVIPSISFFADITK